MYCASIVQDWLLHRQAISHSCFRFCYRISTPSSFLHRKWCNSAPWWHPACPHVSRCGATKRTRLASFGLYNPSVADGVAPPVPTAADPASVKTCCSSSLSTSPTNSVSIAQQQGSPTWRRRRVTTAPSSSATPQRERSASTWRG